MNFSKLIKSNSFDYDRLKSIANEFKLINPESNVKKTKLIYIYLKKDHIVTQK